MWDTKYEKGELSFQRFTNGIIIGPLKTSKEKMNGIIYIIFNDGSFEKIGVIGLKTAEYKRNIRDACEK